jgi:hypothetical protein
LNGAQVTRPYIIKEQAFGGRGLFMCQQWVNTGSSPKMEHAQTCPTPDVVAVMTQQQASPPDVSIAGMTKSSSKVLGRFPTIKSITGRWCYRKANIKRVQLYARPKSPGFERGSGCSSSNKTTTTTTLRIPEDKQSQLHIFYHIFIVCPLTSKHA